MLKKNIGYLTLGTCVLIAFITGCNPSSQKSSLESVHSTKSKVSDDVSIRQTSSSKQNAINVSSAKSESKRPMPPRNIIHMDMVSAQDGWAYGYGSRGNMQLVRTTDGGRIWTPISLPVAPPAYDLKEDQIGGPGMIRSDFLNASSGWIGWVDTQTHVLEVLKTIDGGVKWYVSSTKVPKEFQLLSRIRFLNASAGWVLGSFTHGVQQPTEFLLRSIDSGKQWAEVRNFFSRPLLLGLVNSFTFNDSKQQLWMPLSSPSSNQVSLLSVNYPENNLSKVVLPTPEKFQKKSDVVGTYGPILSGEEGTFVAEFSKLAHGRDRNYLVTYHSHDAGVIWRYSKVMNNLSVGYQTIDFITPEIGWMVAGNKLYSTNIGHRWNKITNMSRYINFQDSTLLQLDFVTKKVGWMLIESKHFTRSKILFTDNGGHSWTTL